MSEERLTSPELTATQLKQRADDYRRMAGTALEAPVVAALLRLAERYERIASDVK